MARAFDPVLLATDCGITPDPWQATLLRTRPKRALLCCARQSGKTTVACIAALWVALYEASALVLIVSPSQRQSGEVFRSLMILYGRLKDAPELVMESALRAQLSNGSRLIALPGSERTVRGYAGAKLVVLDEAAQVPDALVTAVRPTLAVTDGSLIALSTPFGARGWFHAAWVGEGESDWHKVMVTAMECPRLSADFLEGECRALGEQAFRQEYMCEFTANVGNMFPPELVDRAFTDDIVALW